MNDERIKKIVADAIKGSSAEPLNVEKAIRIAVNEDRSDGLADLSRVEELKRELVGTMFCEACNSEKARIYAVLRSGGVRENITEPERFTGIKRCPDSDNDLIFTRAEDGPLPTAKNMEPVVDTEIAPVSNGVDG